MGITDRRLTGFLAGQKDSPRYVTPAVICRISPYEAEQVVNGINRVYRSTNLWVADQKEAWLEFSWETSQRIGEIRCTFNPGLELELPSSITISENPHHGFSKRTGEPEQLVKDFDIYVEIAGQMEKVGEVRNNYQRLCVIPIAAVKTRKVRIVFRQTWGKVPAEVFEIRFYEREAIS